jgi:hypothetical protein
MQRPTLVTVLGWLWMAFGVFSVLGGVMGLAVHVAMMRSVPGGEFPDRFPDMPAAVGPMLWLFRHWEAFAVIQICVAVITLFAAVQFLRLRPWARTYFETISWLGIAANLVFAVYFAIVWLSASSTVPEGGMPRVAPGVFAVFGVVAALSGALFGAVLPGVIIWLLRRPEVRSAFSRSPSDGEIAA